MKFKSVVILLIAFLSGCIKPPLESRSLVIEMQRTACYGACPVYQVEIYDDLSVIYTGEAYVPLKGEHIFRIKKREFNDLISSFVGAKFFQFKTDYSQEVTDLPTTYLEFNHEGKSKKIRDYYGAPQELKDLENKVEEFVEETIWKSKLN